MDAWFFRQYWRWWTFMSWGERWSCCLKNWRLSKALRYVGSRNPMLVILVVICNPYVNGNFIEIGHFSKCTSAVAIGFEGGGGESRQEYTKNWKIPRNPDPKLEDFWIRKVSFAFLWSVKPFSLSCLWCYSDISWSFYSPHQDEALWKIVSVVADEPRNAPERTWVLGGGIETPCKYDAYAGKTL